MAGVGVHRLVDAAFEYLIAKLTGGAPEEEQPPEGHEVVENLAAPVGDPNDDEEAFRQETLALREAMHASEFESTARGKQQEMPMYQWSGKDFHDHFPQSILLPEVSTEHWVWPRTGNLPISWHTVNEQTMLLH